MNPSERMSVGLVHYPIIDKAGKIVATNVTNLDVHDIARASRVYGVEQYFIINPMREQLMYVSRILDFWATGTGRQYNHMRRTALVNVRPVENIREAIGRLPKGTKVVGTSARAPELSKTHNLELLTFRGLRSELESGQSSYLLLFGTGFGLADDVFKECHAVLEPLRGQPPQDYRHLSVRSAVSICLDRLLGTW